MYMWWFVGVFKQIFCNLIFFVNAKWLLIYLAYSLYYVFFVYSICFGLRKIMWFSRNQCRRHTVYDEKCILFIFWRNSSWYCLCPICLFWTYSETRVIEVNTVGSWARIKINYHPLLCYSFIYRLSYRTAQ